MDKTRSWITLAGLWTALLVSLTSPLTVAAAGAGYYTQSGKIYEASGQELQIRGISHFGFNADILMPQYLWQMGWKEQIAQIKSLGFNAVRVPFVPDTLYVTTPVNQLGYVDPNKNAELIGKTPLQVLDLWMAEAERQGLYVMLDFHSVSKVNQYQTWFVEDPNAYGAGKWAATWNTQPYTADNWKRDLAFVAARYAHLPHFFAIDIFNEPQGIVRWSVGDPNATNPKNFWKPAAEGAAAAVLAANPKLLIFVQGINANNDGVEKPNIPINWGENFQPQRYQPLSIAADKLVLSPHTYGPDVYVKPSFSASNYPANLAADWETLFGQFSSQIPVVIGEWGGRYGQGGVGQKDVQWQNALVDYLLSKNIRSSFYWCYTPNSGDSGGVLDDNLAVRQDKMALLQRHWGGAATAPAATLALSASSYTVAQSAGALNISVNRAGSSTAAASVNYATANGTAAAGSDYTAKSGTLNWAAGDTTAKSFSVAISNLTPFSGSKSFSVNLSNASSGMALASPNTAAVTISGSAVVNNGNMVLSASSYSVGQAAGSLTVAITRTGGATGAVNVQYATVDGTAKAGIDYTALTGSMSWGGGDTSTRTISVPISNSTPFTGSRSFTIKLASPAGGATLGSPSTATATINGSKPATSTGYAQPSISKFSPASGPVGTVVTVFGRGFTGVNTAWVGSAKNAVVKVVNDGKVTVRIPAGATSGAIGIFNPSSGAFTATSFTVSTSTAQYVQPQISSFSPASGPVGTVVTVLGSGFTGANQAWVGSAKNGVVSVVSDTQLKVTIPSGATTGAIGIFNPSYVAFTASSFTVTASSPSYVQPYISSFSPASGPVGTVVTVLGSGFTGANLAWVGNAHNGVVSVISDTQIKVTIPSGATTGAIGIFNPSYVAFTATSFTMTP